MPIYAYRCRNGHSFEVFQKMTDDPVSLCEQCKAPVERVFQPVAVHFKGSGFYTTDYARRRADGDGAREGTDAADKGKGTDAADKGKGKGTEAAGKGGNGSGGAKSSSGDAKA